MKKNRDGREPKTSIPQHVPPVPLILHPLLELIQVAGSELQHRKPDPLPPGLILPLAKRQIIPALLVQEAGRLLGPAAVVAAQYSPSTCNFL